VAVRDGTLRYILPQTSVCHDAAITPKIVCGDYKDRHAKIALPTFTAQNLHAERWHIQARVVGFVRESATVWFPRPSAIRNHSPADSIPPKAGLAR